MNIKHTLLSALDGDKRSAKLLCDQFRRMAVAYLRTKINYNNYLLNHLYTNIEDLALDCIADLFGREDMCFSQLEAYLDRNEVLALDESEVMMNVRRLVFSKVNEGLFRNYSAYDPSLSKIIRNLKRSLDEEKIKGMSYYVESGAIIHEAESGEKSRPEIADELLEIKLSAHVSSITNSVDAIHSLKEILVNETAYASKVPLINFAIILRKVFARQIEADETNERLKNGYSEEELHTFLENSIAKQQRDLKRTYVDSQKITEHEFDRYLLVARQIIRARFIQKSAQEGHFEHFQQCFPEVPYGRYRENYRKIVEYIVKKIRHQLIMDIKKEENFSKTKYW